jgi:uncharacterized membrane protein
MSHDEDRDAAVMRTILAEVTPPPGRTVAADLLHDGRRARRRRRRSAAAAGVAAVSLAAFGGVSATNHSKAGSDGRMVSPAAVGASNESGLCAVTRLELPAQATRAMVNAGSPSGRFLVGFSSEGNSTPTPVRWDGTRAEFIAVGGPAEANDVNDKGVAVGGGRDAAGRSTAWAYVSGNVVTLPIPVGYTAAEATAINAHGDVAGVLFDGDRTAAVVWRGTSADAEVNVLSAPGRAAAFGISDEGVVVGGVNGDDKNSAFVWSADGGGGWATVPDGFTSAGMFGVQGEWAYGPLGKEAERRVPIEAPTAAPIGDRAATHPPSGNGTNSRQSAVIWDLRTGRPTIVPDGDVRAVSARGETSVNHDDRTASLRSADGTLRSLPSLPGEDSAYAFALSDGGTQVAGVSGNLPVRWQCSAGAK